MSSQYTDQQLSALAASIAEVFMPARLKLATAESCTGGWVAKLMTDIAGSSGWFERGFVTYSNEAKHEMLSVPEKTLKTHGAVCAEVVSAMTEGALQHSYADWALAISGIAGPGGGSTAKPVGTVWFAWQRRGRPAESRMQLFSGDRDAVRRAACVMAMTGLLDRCNL